jgi:RNA polymerase sigma factor (sigma-70 family)
MSGEEFERRYTGPIRSVLRKKGATWDQIEDTCQDVFIKCRHLGEAPPIPQVLNWAIHAYFTQLRKQGREERFRAQCLSRVQSKRRKGTPMPLDAGSERFDPASALEETELHSLLRLAVSALPPSLREVARLHTEGQSHKQIAHDLSITVLAVKLRFRRAKKALKNDLRRHYQD